MTIRCLICDHNDAGHRYACDNDLLKLQHHLRDLDTYWDLLPLLAAPTRGATGRGSPGYASRSPARDDVLVMLDIRSSGDVYGPDDLDDPLVSLPTGVAHIVTWVRQLDPSPPRWAGIGYLLSRVPHVAMTTHIALFASQVRILHGRARALAHDQPPRPLGTCTAAECDGAVFQTWRDEGVGARCRACSKIYTGLDLLDLPVAQQKAS